MNVLQLAILTILSEDERSVNELREYLGIDKKRIIKSIRSLEKKGLVERKTYLGEGDVIFGITEEGIQELYKYYMFLRDLVKEMEISVCTRFDC
ncbi:ArsR family transcriptional regulator [Sulfolobus sp. S-194]|uniref:winged helix-turn-helix domain-containing protein n=1 Tax=Sulfolobus sp. S-194 TaxID=2512240 RepID=UPI001436DF48|nr:winged helix-turn-helix domain-containing protein [Sulfolobus sp. S-194]QIW23661.1 ArsR family transcriptional regulator [Sulfolobus sp. S-194]